jgi:exopolysaccharide biosynthesis polyprenyl glycosylphosphotransferase
LQSLFLLWVVSLILQLQIASLIFLLSGFIAPALISLQRHLFSQMVARLRRKGGHEVRVLVYGAGDSGRNIVSALIESQRIGLRPFAVFEDRNAHHASAMPAMGYRGRNSIPVLNGILTADTLLAYRADLLLIASANLSPERIAAANDAAKLAGTSVAILCSPSLEEQPFASRFEIDGMQLSVQTNPSKRRFYIFAKRLLDVVLSSLLLVLLSPLLLMIAALIRLDSPGPALFIQERVGLNGSLFRMFKFRTMYASTPKYELSPTSSRDWRITCVGRALRRTGLDELPQLVNVFLGEMSLVGPRPEMPFIVDRYTPTEMQRLNVIPGVTGLWQLSADRAFPIHQNVEYDFYYIRNRTLAMDIAILAHTLVFAMCGGI